MDVSTQTDEEYTVVESTDYTIANVLKIRNGILMFYEVEHFRRQDGTQTEYINYILMDQFVQQLKDSGDF